MAENILYSSTESDDEEYYSRTDYSDTETSEEEMYLQMQELSLNEGEGLRIQEIRVNEREKRMARCESCVGDKCRRSEGSWSERLERTRQLYGRVAVFLCFACKIYVCAKCMSEHEGHNGMNVGRKERERQEREKMGGQGERGRMRRDYIDMVLKEDERRRTEIFNNSDAIVCDRVEVKHERDQKDCNISGLCGLENKRWVACDMSNHCIKIYKVGSHVLQRYIRFVGSGSEPWDVTEIHLKQNYAEPNLASGSRSDISATDRADPNKPCVIAVTLPRKRQIMFININKKTAKLQKVLETERRCWSIQFNDDKIFTLCREDVDTPLSVYIQSTDGVTSNMFNIGIDSLFPGYPYLAVVSGRVYITDSNNDKVHCINVKDKVISEFTIEGSLPTGISVDPDNNVYVWAWNHNKVYKLDADLTRYKSVLDQTAGYIEEPRALCCYRDKLFISHDWPSSLQNFVTVVRLL